MAEKYIKGSMTVTELGLPSTPAMLDSIKSLDAVNDAETVNQVPLYSTYAPYIQDIYGGASARVFSEDFKVYFSPNGVAIDAVPAKGYKKYFDMYREDYIIKNIQFTPDFKRIAKENGFEWQSEVTKTTKAVTNAYANRYLPLTVRKALITGSSMSDTLPSVNTDFFANKGVLNGTYMSNVIGKDGQVVRNHLRGLAGTTVTAMDIFNSVQYIQDYEDYSMMGVYGYCNARTMATLKNSLNFSSSFTLATPQIKFGAQNGYNVIEDIIFINDPMLPDNFVLFVDIGATGDQAPITRFQSKVSEYRGLAIYQEKSFTSFDEPDVLEGSKFVVQAESFNLTGRSKALWLHLGQGQTVGSDTAVMSSAGQTALLAYATLLNKKIYGV